MLALGLLPNARCADEVIDSVAQSPQRRRLVVRRGTWSLEHLRDGVLGARERDAFFRAFGGLCRVGARSAQSRSAMTGPLSGVGIPNRSAGSDATATSSGMQTNTSSSSTMRGMDRASPRVRSAASSGAVEISCGREAKIATTPAGGSSRPTCSAALAPAPSSSAWESLASRARIRRRSACLAP